jgi:hypothetical protein
MIALLLVFGLFLYLSFVGQALVSLFKPRLGVLWSWFVAPTFGLALIILLATRLNVWGLPVKSFGPWLTLGLGLAAAAIFWWRRPVFPWRRLAPFFAICVVYLLYTGWPMLRFGFDWISYGNDDMANYCLAADRFLNFGYYDIPLQTDLEGHNYAQHYWFMHALQQIRPGSELTVAWIAAITGLRAHEAFMPAIMLLSLLQIFALGSIVIFRGRYRRLALIALGLFAISPLFGLGTLYQLIAQVGGIAILLVASSLLLSTRGLSWRKAAVTGIITGCLGVFYPEVSPFVALTVLMFALRLRYQNMDLFKRYALTVGVAALLTFILIGSNTYQFINTLVMQSVGSAGLGAMAEINDQSGGLVLFPWTLVPSFVPMVFGLHPFGVVGTDPIISLKVLAGLALLGFLIWRTWRNLQDQAPVGYLATVMLALGFYLFFKGQDFGLFKLAMFIQPVVMVALAQGFAYFLFSTRPKWRRRSAIALGAFALFTVDAHTYYSYASLGTYGGGLTEVVHASRLGVGFNPPKDLEYDGIHSDISNVVTAKMLAQYTQGIDTRFLSRSYMDNIANIAVLKFLRDPDPDLGPQARLIEKLSLLRWLLPDELMKGDVPDYRVMTINKLDNNWTHTSSRHLDYRDRLFVAVRSELDHFNKANPGDGWGYDNMYQYKLESQLKDRLVFVHSELSPHYYSAARFKAAFFQREPEPITKGQIYFHGTGRFNVFQIINPSEKLRVVVDFSRTSLGEGRSELPKNATVIGEEDYPLPFVGHGSARIISPPIRPEYFDQSPYITLDFGETPRPIDKPKTGLMRLYGERFNLDDRRLVGFTRDISVITEEQYLAMERPTRISHFPADLVRYSGLEYSGMYEDGWMADHAYFKLGASRPGQILTFRGFVPATQRFETEGVDIGISINGTPTEIVNVKSGEFTLTRLIREPVLMTSIDLRFSAAERYGQKDKREVSAFVRDIVIEDITDFATLRSISAEQGAEFELEGVDSDGWIGEQAAFKIAAFRDFRVLKVDWENPGAAPYESNQVTATLNGKAKSEVRIPRADYGSLLIPLPPGEESRIDLATERVFPLPNESRERSLLIKNISFENLRRADLFENGWHRSGYMFSIRQPDADGWVDREAGFEFPATRQFHQAIIQVVRYPAPADMPLEIEANGRTSTRDLRLDETETIRVPLSEDGPTTVNLKATRSYRLAAPDTRTRSFRIVNIDFE